MGLAFNRKSAYRAGGLSVTDLTAAEWCQQQLAFKLSMKWPKEVLETAAMQAGTAHHALLEAEVSTKVELAVATREDAWAVRLLNMMTCLQQLRVLGLTREMFIFGQLERPCNEDGAC
ncbi:hypothetical protein WJX72_007810 [[Myrmecia] bisecta]|uniref:Uncharacterized protein n=1 Tax=[Myrmecia] bisecta TaxID=41462 RepID=A0AAW1P4W1_9CHLO